MDDLVYCKDCGIELGDGDSFCKSCGNPQKGEKPKAVDRKSGGGFRAFFRGLFILLVVLIVVGAILFAVYTLYGDKVAQKVDPCERAYERCVHECGEGWLSGACKLKCTVDRDECWEKNR